MLEWTGRGKQPKWYEFALKNGFTEDQLLVANQAASSADADIDLGIGDVQAETPIDVLNGELVTINSGIPKMMVIDTQDQPKQVIQTDDFANRDLANQLLGQAQAFAAASGLLRTFGVSKLAFVKEKKLYRGLEGMRTPNGSELLSGTWEEYCSLLGVSVDKVDTDIANLRAFGEEALESMSRMGIGYRELRQFRKLPADQREALAQIATTGTKDDVLEAAYEAIEAERSKRSELEVQNAELSEDLKLAEKRGKNLDAEIERKEMKIKKLSSARQRCTAFLDRTEDIRAECLALQAEAELPMAAIQKLFEEIYGEDHDLAEWQVQAEQVWITANVVAARATAMIEQISILTDGLCFPERIGGTHIMTPAEAQRWLLDYPMILNRHEAEAAQRKEARDAAKPKGPGRPKGSANKADE
jgi:hypothetical protein